jgi:NADPH-dependent 2,4-dienoyl-CoA reductase/sulfur reductase-like enzyme
MRRRDFLGAAVTAALAPCATVAIGRAAPRAVVVGGGFAGASCARALRRADPAIAVTLVEPEADYVACPLSNEVIAGLRPLEAQRFSYDRIAAEGVRIVRGAAIAVDAKARVVTLARGERLAYDRLVLAPGIDIRWGALPGYVEGAQERMPHAWRAGPQTALLRRQLESMEDGGLVVISAPEAPYRCPPAPYERASLVAHYLKSKKPRSKVLVLDAKDSFSMQKLFQDAWDQLYGDRIEWVGLSGGGKVTEVDPGTLSFTTEFGRHVAAVANVIPPQKAGRIAEAAGVADRSGWCPVDPATFESKLQPGIHVIGDAAITGALPKSAFAAHSQAVVCARALAASLARKAPPQPELESSCYSVVAPNYGLSISGTYRPVAGQLAEVKGTGHMSAVEATAETRAADAKRAESWFRSLTGEVFG